MRVIKWAVAVMAGFLLMSCAGGNLGRVAYTSKEIGEYHKAIQKYRKANKKEKSREKRMEYAYAIGECYRQIGDYEMAALYYRNAVRRNHPDPKALLWNAEMLRATQKYEEALENYRAFLEEVPGDERVPGPVGPGPEPLGEGRGRVLDREPAGRLQRQGPNLVIRVAVRHEVLARRPHGQRPFARRHAGPLAQEPFEPVLGEAFPKGRLRHISCLPGRPDPKSVLEERYEVDRGAPDRGRVRPDRDPVLLLEGGETLKLEESAQARIHRLKGAGNDRVVAGLVPLEARILPLDVHTQRHPGPPVLPPPVLPG